MLDVTLGLRQKKDNRILAIWKRKILRYTYGPVYNDNRGLYEKAVHPNCNAKKKKNINWDVRIACLT